MNNRKLIAPLLFIVLFILLYTPVFRWLISSWLANSYYNHGFLIPIVSGFLIWRKRDSLKLESPSGNGIILLAVGAVLYIIGFLWLIRFASAISFIIVLSGLVLYLYGIRALRLLAFPLIFLVFMIPPPFQVETIYWLQRISVHSTASLLEIIGLPIATSGNEIILRDNTFSVGAPCSGMSSLIALLALAAVFTYLLSGPLYKKAGLFLAAFPIAIMANILRIISIVLIADSYNTDFATGFYHDISSLIFFFLAFMFIVLCSRIIGCKLRIDGPKK